MSFDIEPKNKEAGVLGKPNGFWNAFFIETPVCKFIEGWYIPERNTINYEHAGFIGEWFSESDALEINKIIMEFVKTEEYWNHSYFSTRRNQMNAMLEFLPLCGGFRRCN